MALTFICCRYSSLGHAVWLINTKSTHGHYLRLALIHNVWISHKCLSDKKKDNNPQWQLISFTRVAPFHTLYFGCCAFFEIFTSQIYLELFVSTNGLVNFHLFVCHIINLKVCIQQKQYRRERVYFYILSYSDLIDIKIGNMCSSLSLSLSLFIILVTNLRTVSDFLSCSLPQSKLHCIKVNG